MLRYQMLVVLVFTTGLMAFLYFAGPTAPPPQTTAPEATEGEALPGATPAPPSTEPATPVDPEVAGKLPPEATPTEDDTFTLRSDELELTFTRIGARLTGATVIIGEEGRDSRQLVPQPAEAVAQPVYPLGLRFAEDALGEALNTRRWEAALAPEGNGVTFRITVPEVARIEKEYRFQPDMSHVLAMDVRYTNLQPNPKRLGMDMVVPAYSVVWGPNVTSGDEGKGLPQEFMWRKEEENTHNPTANLGEPEPGTRYAKQVRAPDFVAVKSAYFVVAMKPEFEQSLGWANTALDGFRVGLAVPRFELAPQTTDTRSFLIYMGPTHLETLQAAWPGLDHTLEFFTWFAFMDWFAKLLLGILNWFHGNVWANYGVAIIALTLLVRLIMFPLTWRMMVSMRKMQLLAPEMEAIKKECGDDQQEFQKRTMEMYSRYGVNPLGGCLPMLLQMPVFFALYRMLWSAYELRRAPFFGWIEDLSEPDRLFTLPFSIPLPFGADPIDSFNLLPILVGVVMLISTKLMPTTAAAQNPQQKIIMNVMPVFIALVTYNMAAGLNLYIFTSTLLGIAQNYGMHFYKVELVPKEKPEKTAKGSKHFYTAAQQRKRKQAREARTERKKRQRTTDAPGKRPARGK